MPCTRHYGCLCVRQPTLHVCSEYTERHHWNCAWHAGNSGGPLLDSFCRVIGVNTATFTKQGSGRGSGVNFALPIDMVRTVVPRLIVYGTSSDRRV